ncbi:hypothetical protein V1511DRAFT_492352 [Dipodascopsis uninucleata]
MVPRKFKKGAKRLPKSQKPLSTGKPISDQQASNSLASHLRSSNSLSSSSASKSRKVKSHGPLGQVRVDKRAVIQRQKKLLSKKLQKITPENVIPELNTALKPAKTIHKRGKKGKVFAEDQDSLNKLLGMVTAKMDETMATKIERANQLEKIREAKRNEIEKREQVKADALEQKKREIKSRKSSSSAESSLLDNDIPGGSKKSGEVKKRKVRFSI